MQQKYFFYPFAASGTLVSGGIPNTPPINGTVNYEEGFGTGYQLQLGTTGALQLLRAQQNQIFYDITLAIQNLQQYGCAEFIDASDNNGSAFPYDAGAITRYSTSGAAPWTLYYSLETANTQTPGTGDNWLSLTAVFTGAAHGSTIFTTVGTNNFVVPANVTSLNTRTYGAGGNGAAGPSGGNGAGGGGGTYVEAAIQVTPGQVIPITIAEGGSLSSTTVGTYITATAGGNASGATPGNGATYFAIGTGATGFGWQGQTGLPGGALGSASGIYVGGGAGGAFGQNAANSVISGTVAVNGQNGFFPGSGGGGGVFGGSGGTGSNGCVVISW